MSLKKVALATMTAAAFAAASVGTASAQAQPQGGPGGSVVGGNATGAGLGNAINGVLAQAASMGIAGATVVAVAAVGLGRFLVTVTGTDSTGSTVQTTITTSVGNASS